jgi:ribonuclease P protein component
VPFSVEIARNEPLSNPAPQNGRNRFPKQRRLLKHADFERVYKQGRRHFASHMTVFYLRREVELGSSNLRIGFTVGKVLGDAVQRNRMKRRLREAVRLTGFTPGISADVVINPKRSLLTVDFRILQGEMAKAFQAVERSFEKGRR